MDDPRDARADPDDLLTEDSEDDLADLEKEFELKKQQLLEERARKRERKRTQVQIVRSPSPERRKAPKPVEPSRKHSPETKVRAPFQRAPAASLFASRLHEGNPVGDINFNERIFGFDNIPKRQTIATTETDRKDSLSGEVLSRRYYADATLKELMCNIKVLRIGKLLAKIAPPRFEEPNYVNWCLVGIVVHKSEPKNAVNKQKYMALRVGNFVHTVDVMLFGDAFRKYWKVRCGDVVVILNPTVKKFGSSFTLSLLDNLDSLLEVGTAQDFAYCTAKNKSGENCKNIVDRLKHELCTFHEESRFKQGMRMDIQGSVKPKAPQNARGQKSELYMNSASKPVFVQYNNAGFHEKDVLYGGGEQFDEAKYDRPIAESAASRLRKQRANQKLLDRLVELAAPSRLESLERLGIISEQTKQHDSLEKLRLQAFKSSFISGMGYDPTVSSMAPNKTNQLQSLLELRSLSKGKKISLRPSQAERVKKVQKWKSNLAVGKPTLANFSQPITPDNHEYEREFAANAKITSTSLGSKLHSRRILEINSDLKVENNDASSDEEIEISFTTDADRMRYVNATAHGGTSPRALHINPLS